MSDTLIASTIAAAALLLSGLLTALVTVGTLVFRWIKRIQSDNHSLWTYTRQLIDHIYRGGIGPPPPPPPHIAHIYEGGELS